MRKNNLLMPTCIFFSLLLFGAITLQAQSWQPQLNSLNEYLKIFDNGYYGYLEIKDGVVYVRFKKGKFQSFRLEEIEDALAVSEKAVQFNCKNGAKCIVSEFTPDTKLNGSGFSQSGNYKNTKELATLFNNFKNAYLGNRAAPTNTQPTTTTIDNDTAPDARLAGLWNINTKDQYGLTDTNKMELKIVNGKLEAWLFSNGKPTYKYNEFSVFKNGNDTAFAFQLKLAADLPLAKGSGTVSNDFNRMQGTSLKPLYAGSNEMVVEEWTATKAGASVFNIPVNNNSKPSSNNTAPYAELAGLWNITIKDHRTNSASNAQMEIRAANGQLEAWRVVSGKADIKYTAFKVFKDGNDISYTFELNVTSLKVEGVGKISGNFSGMTGSQIMSMNGIQFSGDWTAVKTGVSSSQANANNTPSTNALQAQELKPALDYKTLKIGYADEKGNIVIQGKYHQASSFSEGLASVLIEIYGWGFIDKTGKEIIPLKYGYAGNFSEGLAVVNIGGKSGMGYKGEKKDIGGKWGFIDKTGKEVIPAKYEFAEPFKNGKAKVILNGGEFYIDKTGKEIK